MPALRFALLGTALVGVIAFAGPAARQPVWSSITDGPMFRVYVDLKSPRVRTVDSGKEVHARLKLQLKHEAPVSGSTLLGSYYINEITVKCKEDLISVDAAVLYAKDGTVIARNRDVDVGELANPHVRGKFVTDFIDEMCNDGKNSVPVINI